MIQTLINSSALAALLKKLLPRIPGPEESFFFNGPRKNRAGTASGNAGLLSVRWAAISWRLLLVLVIGAVFIPRIPLGGFSRYYSLDLKVEDLALAALMVVFFVFRPAGIASAWRHALETCFVGFLLAASVSIAAGMLSGTLDKPLMSVLYLVKWFEYFLIFFFSARLSQMMGPRPMIVLFFLMGLVLAAYGYYEHFYPVSKAAYPNYYRLYERAPFHGDANHIGGLLATWLAFFSYLYLREPSFLSLRARSFLGGHGNHDFEIASSTVSPRKDKSGWAPWILLGAILFVYFPFIWTFSRKSYLAFSGAYLLLFFLVRGARRQWVLLGCLLICAGLLLPTRLAERVSDLGDVLSAVDPYHSSWAGNMDVWKRCFWNFDQFWLFGAGLGARHRLFYESQYVLTLTETGLFGFSIFIAMLMVPALCALRRLNALGHQGLFAGAWLSAWAAFMLHNLSCVSLTVSKCAVVWWFLTGAFIGAMERKPRS